MQATREPARVTPVTPGVHSCLRVPADLAVGRVRALRHRRGARPRGVAGRRRRAHAARLHRGRDQRHRARLAARRRRRGGAVGHHRPRAGPRARPGPPRQPAARSSPPSPRRPPARAGAACIIISRLADDVDLRSAARGTQVSAGFLRATAAPPTRDRPPGRVAAAGPAPGRPRFFAGSSASLAVLRCGGPSLPVKGHTTRRMSMTITTPRAIAAGVAALALAAGGATAVAATSRRLGRRLRPPRPPPPRHRPQPAAPPGGERLPGRGRHRRRRSPAPPPRRPRGDDRLLSGRPGAGPARAGSPHANSSRRSRRRTRTS